MKWSNEDESIIVDEKKEFSTLDETVVVDLSWDDSCASAVSSDLCIVSGNPKCNMVIAEHKAKLFDGKNRYST